MYKKNLFNRSFFSVILFCAIAFASFYGFTVLLGIINEKRALEEVIMRLTATSRSAQVIVSNVQLNPLTQKYLTTIKFLEYDSRGRSMAPKYFTFSGNLIQFQSLVVRFEDNFVKKADALRGKSIYLFWKVFVLDGASTQEFVLSPVNEIPQGYKTDGPRSRFEEEIWKEFWSIAMDPQKAKQRGIKNAQIEAPGTKFVPGILYTITIEHDGGLRIDTSKIPEILKGEKVMSTENAVSHRP